MKKPKLKPIKAVIRIFPRKIVISRPGHKVPVSIVEQCSQYAAVMSRIYSAAYGIEFKVRVEDHRHANRR